MKIKSLALALALAVAGPAMAATCTQTFNLGSMGPPGASGLGNSFYSTGKFNDCYNFTLNNSADSKGLTGELDLSLLRDINLTSVSLSGGGLPTSVDTTASSFSFNNLVAGAYQLIISGDVTGINFFGLGGPVGYLGTFSTSVAAPVPEPETYAMMALGLGAVGWVARRRKQGDTK